MPTKPERRAAPVSLTTKLAGVTTLVLGVVTLGVYVELTAYQSATLLSAKEGAAQMVARLFAANVSAPLVFGDDKGVGEAVGTLATNDDVLYGAAWAVTDAKVGDRLGELLRTDVAPPPPAGVPETLRSSRDAQTVTVDAPVHDPTGKTVGVSRVVFSLARENAAIATMSRRFLWGSLAAALALGALLIYLTRALIIRPVRRLGAAARRLESGERVEIQVDSADEIGQLAGAFAAMSAAIEERERRIAQRNRDMRLVLDHVGDGFLTVGIDGRMVEERSRVLDTWFGAPVPDESFFAYVGRIAPETAPWLELGWESLRDAMLPSECVLGDLPRTFSYGERSFQLGYTPLLEEGDRPGAVLVSVRDVTAEVERERAEARKRELLAIFRRMLDDRSAFGGFLEEGGSTVRSIVAFAGGDTTLLRRQVHTLKGNATLFGVESVARACHDLESQLEDDPVPEPAGLARIQRDWEAMRASCQELGWRDADVVQVPAAEVRAVLESMQSGGARATLVAAVGAWLLDPAQRRLERLAAQTTALAQRLGKGTPRVEVVPTSLRLPASKWEPIFAAMAHVVRNTVDHGLETEGERVEAGKPVPARVRLSLEVHGDDVVLTVADDGRGIDWDAIRGKAARAGLPSATNEDLREALFADGVSSRDEVTETSGRGVGMGAVRAAVQARGGRIELETERGRGTTFHLVLPSSMLVADGRPSGHPSHAPPGLEAAE